MCVCVCVCVCVRARACLYVYVLARSFSFATVVAPSAVHLLEDLVGPCGHFACYHKFDDFEREREREREREKKRKKEKRTALGIAEYAESSRYGRRARQPREQNCIAMSRA